MAKKSVLLYHDLLTQLEDFTDEQFGKVVRAVIKYDKDSVLPDFKDSTLSIAFKMLKPSIDRNKEEYEAKCETNRKNIQKRWEKQHTTEYDRIGSIQANTTDTDNDNDNDNVNDKDIKENKEKEEKKGNAPKNGAREKETKTLSLVREYFTDEEIIIEIGCWLKHKQEKGQSYKTTGLIQLLTRLAGDLEKFGKEYVIGEIKHSISNNYSGIYPSKEQKSKPEKVAQSQYTEADLKRYRREE